MAIGLLEQYDGAYLAHHGDSTGKSLALSVRCIKKSDTP